MNAFDNDIYGSNPMKEFMKGISENRFFNERFLEQRKIFLWGPVTDDSAKDIINRLLYLEAEKPGEEIIFYINSPGGSVPAGMGVYDAMKLITSPVSTVCIGYAASMGAILLSSGDKGKRFVWPHAEVMIHQPSIGGYFQDDARNLQIWAKHISRTKEVSARILAKNCDKTYEQIIKDFDRDYWMNGEEARDYGIIDGIVEKLEK